MKSKRLTLAAITGCGLLLTSTLPAQEWPQWRGPHRDGKVDGFAAPKVWPKELTQKWKVDVGPGDATPALSGGKLYVFARAGEGEAILCLDARDGKEIWRKTYAAAPATEPMGHHPGPRSSPVVAAGKVVVYGVRGQLTCLDAASGNALWSKDEFAGGWPKFFTASSPLIADGLCVAQLGGEEKGGLFAYDLATGDLKWKWTEDGTAYASPVLATLAGVETVVALTTKKAVGLALADGKPLWEAPYAPQGGRTYNSATPIVDGGTIICAGSGRGAQALKIEKTGAAFAARELWATPENNAQFNTPVLKDGRLYGITLKGALFCESAQDGKTQWSLPLGAENFGSVVDLGPVLAALTPGGKLVVFEPGGPACRQVAEYQVAETATYAYPVIAGNQIYIKDKTSLARWSLE
jgi:outer membrane protein assembly factor BamB